jgi:hypothetical protein
MAEIKWNLRFLQVPPKYPRNTVAEFLQENIYSLCSKIVVTIDFLICVWPFILLKKIKKYHIFYYDMFYH